MGQRKGEDRRIDRVLYEGVRALFVGHLRRDVGIGRNSSLANHTINLLLRREEGPGRDRRIGRALRRRRRSRHGEGYI